MCDTCSEGGTQATCPECRERAGLHAFPLNRANWNFSALWDYTWEAFKREGLMLSLGALCLMVMTFIVQAVGGILPLIGKAVGSDALNIVLQIIATTVQTVVNGVLGLGFLRMVFDVLQGGKADVGRLFSQLHKAVPYFVTTLLVFLIFFVPTLVVGGVATGVAYALGGFEDKTVLFVVLGATGVLALGPAIYFGLPTVLVQPAMVLEESFSSTDYIRHAYTLARGERLSILGVGIVCVLLAIAGFLACCVGLIPGMALIQLLLGGLYLSLRTADNEMRY
jgi:hypothetical protein